MSDCLTAGSIVTDERSPLEIISKNIHKIRQTIRQEDPSCQKEEIEPERQDTAYMAWKDWTKREADRLEERKNNLREAAKKEKSWNLYRECTRILEENRERWMARKKEEEEQRRLETEKQDRLKKAGNKKQQSERKLKESLTNTKKKETKLECSRRLEEKKKLDGKLKMRSELWKQRREKDGKLVRVWKEMKKETDRTLDIRGNNSHSSHAEDDPWMEEITLTDQERTKLEELEKWYQTPHTPPYKTPPSNICNITGANMPQGTSSRQVGPVTNPIMPPTTSLGSSYEIWSVSQSESPHPPANIFQLIK